MSWEVVWAGVTAVFRDGNADTPVGVSTNVDSANALPSTDGLDFFSEVGVREYDYGQMH